MKIGMLIAVIIVLFCADRIIFADTISIRADIWAPYNAEPKSIEPGYAIEVAKVIFEKSGYKVDYDTLPWSRAIMETREGVFTAVVGAARGDVPDFVFPEEEIGRMSNAFFVISKSKWKYSGISSLTGQALGTIGDYSYGKDLDEYIQKNVKDPNKIQEMYGEYALMQNIKKLQAEKISVLVEDRAAFLYRLKQMKIESGIVEAGMIAEEPIYIAFSPKNPKATIYAKMLSNGIVELRKSGKLKEILQKYGLKDWKK